MILDTVDNLITFAKYHLDLNEKIDEIYVRNLIYSELEIIPDTEERNLDDEEQIKNNPLPDKYVNELIEYFVKEKGFSEGLSERKTTKIMGFLTKSPSEIVNTFKNIYKGYGDKDALNYLYNLSISNYYYQKSKVDKNIVWSTSYPSKNIEISINLSKPEKNNKDIAKLLKVDKSEVKYPKCLLCLENLGFEGTDKHPARENLRVIPLNLDEEEWYLQYSPYGYFKKHCIVFSKNHNNMVINESTFRKLIDFVDLFPSFFIGSNADLPIVGGSILNHEHFQGGEHLLPVMKSEIKREFKINYFDDVNLYQLDWYNSALLVKSKNKEHLVKIATIILNKWRAYDDLENNILSNSNNEKHNTITPSLRKVNDEYYLYLILRNNRCNEEFPDGIFHAHKEYHNIKKEGIGIIEAMGLFILPARLNRQLNEVKDCLVNNYSDDEILKKYEGFAGFLPMIHDLNELKNQNYEQNIKEYVEKVCTNILRNTAVFKDDEKGNLGLEKFIGELNL